MKISVDGWDIEYLTPEASPSVSQPLMGFDRLEDELLAGHGRLRRFLVRFFASGPYFYYVMHWSDGFDLSRLDSSVVEGMASDADFHNALVGEARSIQCMKCGAIVRAVIADTAGPIFAADRPRRLREHSFVERCPVCRQEWEIYAMEVMDGKYEAP